MSDRNVKSYGSVAECVDQVIAKVGKKIVLGLPLGLGKPNQLVNEFYRRAKEDPEIDLTISTALSLERPTWGSDLERRFLEPFVERVFGGYIDLDYVLDMRKNALPPNVQVKEFYTKAGAYLNLRHAQQNYVSSNYTHAYRDILESGANVVAQMVCRAEVDGQTRYSLSCNPDVTLDVAKALRKQEQETGRPVAVLAQVNQNLPFMYGDAVVEPDFFHGIVDHRDLDFPLFGAPKMAVTTTDFMIGLYASSLIKDGGTLQIGIGSLGDALCYGLQLRQEHNDTYQKLFTEAGIRDKFGESIDSLGGVDPFEQGLLGSTEMLVDGYLHLMKSGIIKRKSYNHEGLQKLCNQGRLNGQVYPETVSALLDMGSIQAQLTQADFDFLQLFGIFKAELSYQDGFIQNGSDRIPADLGDEANRNRIFETCLGSKLKNEILIHGGFYLGPQSFYQALNDMSDEERKRIHMTSVLNTNHLYANEYGTEELRVLQRQHGRFVNACLMVTLSGAVVSDGLDSGQMVSGVGGQYNFVSQAHALENGRSILMCKGLRAKGKDIVSNIVFNYGHITIPRHLRDIVITEYGIANLRGKSDQEIIAALLNITDSRFQDDLLAQAKQAGKIGNDYQIPARFLQNTPERLEALLSPYRKEGFFPPFPFGTDFTDEELVIGKALKTLKARMSQGMKKISSLSKAVATMKVPEKAQPYLARLQLDNPKGSKERMMRKLVIHALSAIGKL